MGTAFFVFASLLAPRASVAQVGRDVSLKILDADDGSTGEVDLLRDALEAHLAGHRIEISTHRIPTLPALAVEQAEIARTAAGDGGVRAVLWVAPVSDSVYLMLLDGETERIVEREMPRLGEGVGPYCDAIASMALFAVSSVAERKPRTARDWALVQEKDPETPIDPALDDVPKPLRMGLSLELGWGLHLGSGTRPINHGAHLAVGYHLTRHAAIEASFDFPLAATLGEEALEGDYRLVRIPLRLVVHGFLPVRRVSFGLGLGAGMERVDIKQSPDSVPIRGYDEVRPIFCAQAMVRFRLLDWLEARLTSALDVFDARYRRTLPVLAAPDNPSDEQVAFEYGRLRAVISAALAGYLWWDTPRERRRRTK